MIRICAWTFLLLLGLLASELRADNCSEAEFRCRTSGICVRQEAFQDGTEDCDDGSDEECLPDQFRCLCGFPRCLDRDRVGDGVLDCLEGSDEFEVDLENFSCPSPEEQVAQEALDRRRRQAPIVPSPVDVVSRLPLNISDTSAPDDARALNMTSSSVDTAEPMSVVASADLTTKVMPDGVTLIVAGPRDSSALAPQPSPVLANTVYTTFTYFTTFFRGNKTEIVSREEVSSSVETSMLSKTFSIKPTTTTSSLEGITEDPSVMTDTLYTTYTYLNMFRTENNIITITSRTVSSSLYVHPIQSSLTSLSTSFGTMTQLTTNTFYSTERIGVSDVVHSSEEVVTQVIVTEAPVVTTSTSIMPSTTIHSASLQPSSASSTQVVNPNVITKTYLTTYTYFTTYLEGSKTLTTSRTEVATNFVQQTLPVQTAILPLVVSKPQQPSEAPVFAPVSSAAIVPLLSSSSIQGSPAFATKTYFTTYTYFTTFFDGTGTSVSTSKETSSRVVTEPVVMESSAVPAPIFTSSTTSSAIDKSLTTTQKASAAIPSEAIANDGTVIESSTPTLDMPPVSFVVSTPSVSFQDLPNVAKPTDSIISGSTIIFFNDVKSTSSSTPPLPSSSSVSPPSPVFSAHGSPASISSIILGKPTVFFGENSQTTAAGVSETLYVVVDASGRTKTLNGAEMTAYLASQSKVSPSVASTSTQSHSSIPADTMSNAIPNNNNNHLPVMSNSGSNFLVGVAPILGGLAAALFSSGGIAGIASRNDTDKNNLNPMPMPPPRLPPGAIVPGMKEPVFIPLQGPPASTPNIPPFMFQQQQPFPPPTINVVPPSSFTNNRVDLQNAAGSLNAIPVQPQMAPIFPGSFKPGLTEKGFTPIISEGAAEDQLRVGSSSSSSSVTTVTSVLQGQSTIFISRPRQQSRPSIATYTLQGSGSEDNYVTADGLFQQSVIDGNTKVLAFHPENTDLLQHFHTVNSGLEPVAEAAEVMEQSVLALASINDAHVKPSLTTLYTTFTYFTTLLDKGTTSISTREETVSQVKTLSGSTESSVSSLVLHVEPIEETVVRPSPTKTVQSTQKETANNNIRRGQGDDSITRLGFQPEANFAVHQNLGPQILLVPNGGIVDPNFVNGQIVDFLPVRPNVQLPIRNEHQLLTNQRLDGTIPPPLFQTKFMTFTYYTTVLRDGVRTVSSREEIVPSVFEIFPTQAQTIGSSTVFVSVANNGPANVGNILGLQESNHRTTTIFHQNIAGNLFPTNTQTIGGNQHVGDTNTIKTDKVDGPVIHSSLQDSHPPLANGQSTRLLTFTYYTTLFENGHRVVSSREETVAELVTIIPTPASTQPIQTTQQSLLEILEVPKPLPSSSSSDQHPSAVQSIASVLGVLSVVNGGQQQRPQQDNIRPTSATNEVNHDITTDSSVTLDTTAAQIGERRTTQSVARASAASVTLQSSVASSLHLAENALASTRLLLSTQFVTFTYYSTLTVNGVRSVSSREETLSIVKTPTVEPGASLNVAVTSENIIGTPASTLDIGTNVVSVALPPPPPPPSISTVASVSRNVITVGLSADNVTSSSQPVTPLAPTLTPSPVRTTLGTVVSSNVVSDTDSTNIAVEQTESVVLHGSLQPHVRTFYTMYTYFTTFLQNGSPIISSRTETVTRRMTVTPTAAINTMPSSVIVSAAADNQNQLNRENVTGAKTVYRTRTVVMTSVIEGTSTVSTSEEVYSIIMPVEPTRVIVYQDGVGIDSLRPVGASGVNIQPTVTLTGQIVSSVVFGSRTVLYIVNTAPGGQHVTTTIDQQQFRTTIVNGQPTVFIRQTATRHISPSSTTQVFESSFSVTSFSDHDNVQGSTETIGFTTRTPHLNENIKLLGINTSPTVAIGGSVMNGNSDDKQTTLIDSGSTVVSGAKTIFGGLFTRPTGASDGKDGKDVTYTNGERFVDESGTLTRYITYIDSTSRTIVSTKPSTISGTSTNIVSTHVYPRRTMLITVIAGETVINYMNAEQRQLDATDLQKIFGTTAAASPPFATEVPEIPTTRPSNEGSTLLLNAGFGGNNFARATTPKPDSNNKFVAAHSNSKCSPACNMANGEVCKETRQGEHRCLCRPGFIRIGENTFCKAVRTYLVKIPLEKMDKTTLVFKQFYDDKKSQEFRQMSRKTQQGDDFVYSTSNNVGRNFYGSRVTGFTDPNGGNGGSKNGIVAKVAVQVNNNSAVDEVMLRNELYKYVSTHNFTLGQTDLKTSASADAYTVEDFDECSDSDFNDCSEHATCQNTLGSFTCSCKDGFTDDTPKVPGRHCSDGAVPCDFCSFHGVCVLGTDGHRVCKCDEWYLGKNCQVNGFALAIILPIIFGLLLLAALIWICCCCRRGGGCCGCCKPKHHHNKNAAHVVAAGGMFPILGGAPVGANGTLDKKAMIDVDTSSESSGEQSRMAHVADVFGGADTAKSRKSGMSYEDRSISAFVTEAPVLIPRAKHQHPKQYVSTENIVNASDHADYGGAENKLMIILDGDPRHASRVNERNMAIQKESSSFATMPSSGKMAKGHGASASSSTRAATIERSASGGFKGGAAAAGSASRSGDMKHSSGMMSSASKSQQHASSSSSGYYNGTSKSSQQQRSAANSRQMQAEAMRGGAADNYAFESNEGGTSSKRSANYGSSREAADVDTFSSRFETSSNGRFGNTATMSVARSFDETTIHPDTRRLGGDSYYSSSKGRSSHFYRGEEPYHDMDEGRTDVSVSTMMVPNAQIYYEHDSDASESTNPSDRHKSNSRRDGSKYDSYYSHNHKIEIGNTRRESHT